MTSRNRPRVKISKGREKSMRMGRMKALRMPKTSDVTKGVQRLSSLNRMPGTM